MRAFGGFEPTAYRYNGMRFSSGTPLWQRNYYEHIFRNEAELRACFAATSRTTRPNGKKTERIRSKTRR